jgi:hypothetical protein
MAIPAGSIDEVLTELDKIIDTTVAENNFLGLFAYVYRRTTAQIRQAIHDKIFEDNERMKKMDVAFANLYLIAFEQYRNNQPCSASWQVAFAAKKKNITLIQHVMLGMNAHINLDLGVAAATFAPGINMATLKNDFMMVNQVLSELVNEMQDRVAKVSRLMKLLDWIGKNNDELIINFSMAKAREQAWYFACTLPGLEKSERLSMIGKKDERIAAFGKLLISPPGIFLKLLLKIVALFEESDVKTIIAELREDKNLQP